MTKSSVWTLRKFRRGRPPGRNWVNSYRGQTFDEVDNACRLVDEIHEERNLQVRTSPKRAATPALSVGGCQPR